MTIIADGIYRVIVYVKGAGSNFFCPANPEDPKVLEARKKTEEYLSTQIFGPRNETPEAKEARIEKRYQALLKEKIDITPGRSDRTAFIIEIASTVFMVVVAVQSVRAML